MKKRLKSHKSSGMTIIETVIYITLSTIIICCTLAIMMTMIKKTEEEDRSSFRLNKLYSTLNIIEKYTKAENARNVFIKNKILCFTDKSNGNKCEINKQESTLRIKINYTPLYFMHNEYYDADLEVFNCYIKGNLLYINLKLKTGEMMKKCIHIDR